MQFSIVFLVAALAAVIYANDPKPVSDFYNKPKDVASDGAPQWNLPTGTCLPDAAAVNGKQTDGVDPDNCNIKKLNSGCHSQPSWNGANTPLYSFPTYWDLRRCSTTEFRIAYNIYFKKDTGHKSDIEWIIMVWNSYDGGNTFYRSRVIFEQDGNNPSKNWGDIQNTFNNEGDWLSLGNKNRNLARIFVSKWHHSMHDDRYTQFKNTCPPTSASDFRTNDFYFWAGYIPTSWSYGRAKFARGPDICTK